MTKISTARAAFLAACGFSQYGTVGNYNFVTPYQHGQTHGLALGLTLVALLSGATPRAASRRQERTPV